MVQACSKCSRANPEDAVYCYFDGFVLSGQGRAGGPIAIGSQPFSSPFVFPSGRMCRSFDELTLACNEEWKNARDLLKQGYLESFLAGLGRIDLAMAAKESAQFPDPDIGLDRLIEKFPSEVVSAPELKVETEEINLGVVPIGEARSFNIELENRGMRLLYGTISCAEGVWLTLGDKGGPPEKHFQFGDHQSIAVHVAGDRLRAGNKPLEARLLIQSNGGDASIVVRANVPVVPFPSGILKGAQTPRNIAEKAKANPKEAAPLFERGEVAKWYQNNGWTYPVEGPSASGMGAVQQFFEALGLVPAPKVSISEKAITLQGNPGDSLQHVLRVQTPEKRYVYAHGVSTESWLHVERAKLDGRKATINLSIPSIPDQPGETLTAKVRIQANGDQRFVVPVTVQVLGERREGAFNPFANLSEPAGEVEVVEEVLPVARGSQPAPAPVEVVQDVTPVPVMSGIAEVTARPQAPPRPSSISPARAPEPASTGGLADMLSEPPIAPSRRGRYGARGSRNQGGTGIHLIPGALLAVAVLVIVILDLINKPTHAENPSVPVDPGLEPPGWQLTGLKNSEPLLQVNVLTNDDQEYGHFGLEMLQEFDPKNRELKKRLTYERDGRSNNTIVKINGFEFTFGEKNSNRRWLERKTQLPNNRIGKSYKQLFVRENIHATQHVEIVPGSSGYLDTCLVWYTIENKSDSRPNVGLRIMVDTFIGTNDGVPFTIPGESGFLDTMKTFPEKQVPAYIEVIESPNDFKNPGTVARMGLRNITLPGIELEPIDKLQICGFPGSKTKWEVPEISMAQEKDSCVVIYWPYRTMLPGEVRHMAFTYGLSDISIGEGVNQTAVALSAPNPVKPNEEFIVTAYVWGAKKGDKVNLKLPSGVTLGSGESQEKAVTETGQRVQVSWKVKASKMGTYTIEAETAGAKAKPYTIQVKNTGIFG